MRAPDPLIGRSLLNGQFQILRKIGTGGMGAVYEAAQPSVNGKVAVKVLHSKLTSRTDLVTRFHREASAMRHLSHPNTAKVLMYGEEETDGLLYIVMEYLEGRNLNQLVRAEGAIPVERAVPMLVQACHALQEAHDKGIVHRDLKPENIFLCNQGGIRDFVKVLDFGLAKVTDREMQPGQGQLTQEGMVFGTPEFMSPEQAQGEKLDAKSDIYSLAVILYETLTGKLPFEAKNSMEYIQLHVQKTPIPLSKRIAGKTFPPALDAVISKALEKDRNKRYASAMEFANALQAAVSTERVSGNGAVPSSPGSSGRMLSLSPAKMPNSRPATESEAAVVTGRGGGVPMTFVIFAFLLGILLTAGVAFVMAKQP
jgi:serine/threonine protein kinase